MKQKPRNNDIELNFLLKNLLRNPNDVCNFLGAGISDEVIKVANHYPILTSKYYLNLINKNDLHNDPIWKQVIPSIEELQDQSNVSEDPLHEEPQMPVKRLIHRYKDRVVLLTTNRCTMQCRFCFRKRYWKGDSSRKDITDSELEQVSSYLQANKDISEVLVSGGDPLILENSRLKQILDMLYTVDNIDVVRIATRVPVTLPQRVDYKLADMLAGYPGLWFVTHFNHPNEVTEESLEACRKIISRGIPVLNQTVLLKGINDDAVILEKLFRQLIKNKVKPHYLFHVDPVRGVTHFSTGIEKGLEILKSFRNSLSSIAVPHFAIDLPEGGGKVSLQPDYKYGGKYLAIDNKNYISYPQ